MGKRKLITCIYSLVAPDKKVYVGQTTDLINRRSRLKTLTCKTQRKVYESLIKYGYENHSFNILIEFKRGVHRDRLEKFEYVFYELYKRAGYESLNSKACGVATDEYKNKMSESHKGQRVWNKGTKGLQVAWNKGRNKQLTLKGKESFTPVYGEDMFI